MTSTSVNPAAESRPQFSTRPPRMPGIPFLTDNLNMLNDPLRYLVRGYQTLGPVFRVRMGTIEYTILAGLEANGCPCGNVETRAARGIPIETERRIGFEEMIVTADLDRPRAGIRHRQRRDGAARVQLDIAVARDDFTGFHQTPFSRP